MARPSTPHQGFIIPNAKDVVEPILAEPDKIDFNTVANARWGVLTGCLVTGNGGSALSVSEGAVMVDGKFVPVEAKPGLTVTIPPGAPRFSLVVVDDNGVVSIHQGQDSTDPVYPDPKRNETVLAAVFCKTGVSVADSVIDKRKFLPPALLTKIDPTNDLIRNYDQTGALPSDPPQNFYRVLGSGETIWSNDTRVYRSTTSTLRVEDDLSVKRKIVAGDDIGGLTITATENVTARNLRRQSSAPGGPRLGDLWQDPNMGTLYLGTKKGDGVTVEWDEVTTQNGTIPPGTIITSLVEKSRMMPTWLPLDGKTEANEHDYPNLFKVAALTPYMSGTAPNRTMQMPNLTGRVMIGDSLNAGYMGPLVPGTQTPRVNNNIILAKTHMPSHHHAPDQTSAKPVWKTKTGGAVTDLKVTIEDTTITHNHGVTDPGHVHRQPTAVISGATLNDGAVGGASVLTPPSSGRSVLPTNQATESFTGLTVNNNKAAHKHLGSVNDIVAHDHAMDVVPVGGGQPFDITPNFFTTFVYIKT